MKVKELIDLLQQYDGDLEVLGYSDDLNLTADGHDFRVLHIEDVDATEAKKQKIGNVHSLLFEKSDLSEKFVTINVTADF